MRIKTLSDVLYEQLVALQKTYKFKKLHITGHSLADLIIRTFIDRYDVDKPQYDLKLFITLATPWGGVDSAKRVPEKGLFPILPSWRDLAPGSRFIKNLYLKKFPPSIPFYLFFGYKNPNKLIKEGGDGSIAMKSLLDHRAQEEAIKCFGFNETHTSILNSEEVLRRYNIIVEEATSSSK